MNPTAVFLGILAVWVMFISTWLHINNKDGRGWGLVALCLIIGSCNYA